MKIYFAAHATTKDNEIGIASGWDDVELSELGNEQAKQLGERFKDIKLNLVVASDLKRAVDTVKIAFGDKIPMIVDKRLREINYGDLNGAPREKVDGLKIVCIDKQFPNGESYEEAADRIREFFTELKEKDPAATILVVGHRATQYGLEELINGKPLDKSVTEEFKWQPYWEYEF